MMSPAYSITIDPARGLLRLTLSGFFDLETVARFVIERNAAVINLRCRPNQHVTLCDITDQKPSAPDVVAAFQRAILDPRYASRRLAFVVQGTLERMQTRRVANRDNVGYFETLADAEAWLFAVNDTQAPSIPRRA